MRVRRPAWLPRRSYPPSSYRLDDYKRWFPETGDLMARFLGRLRPETLSTPVRGGMVGVVVVPWVHTPAPWYALMLAIGLRSRGRPVTLIFDDSGFPEVEIELQTRVVDKVVGIAGRLLPVVRLSELATQPVSDPDLIRSMTDQNATWVLRGAPREEHHDKRVGKIEAALVNAHPQVRAALDTVDPETLLLAGGVYGSSGLFEYEARQRGIRVATFDTDRHIAQICVDGVAAQNGDLARAFDLIWALGPDERAGAVAVAKEELASRLDLSDRYGFQTVPAGGTADESVGCVLIPMNVEWDTAALGRHEAFDDTIDWVTSTVERVLARFDGPVVVRQHPSERRLLQRSQLDIQDVLAERFAGEDQLRFVAADEPVNSYDLLAEARLVLPYVSNIAIEAAALGKPVLVSGRAYYADKGFVRSATTHERYFELLDAGLRGELAPLPDQEERAWMCYYLNAVRNRVYTHFTSHPDDYWSWVRQTPEELLEDPEVTDILDALDHDIPISVLRHRRFAAEVSA